MVADVWEARVNAKVCRYCGATKDLMTLHGQGSHIAVTITVCERCAERARRRVQWLITPKRRGNHAPGRPR